jgi:hypothetical protein
MLLGSDPISPPPLVSADLLYRRRSEAPAHPLKGRILYRRQGEAPAHPRDGRIHFARCPATQPYLSEGGGVIPSGSFQRAGRHGMGPDSLLPPMRSWQLLHGPSSMLVQTSSPSAAYLFSLLHASSPHAAYLFSL